MLVQCNKSDSVAKTLIYCKIFFYTKFVFSSFTELVKDPTIYIS
jgi:hypothetical protein